LAETKECDTHREEQCKSDALRQVTVGISLSGVAEEAKTSHATATGAVLATGFATVPERQTHPPKLVRQQDHHGLATFTTLPH
jgi:hypothetical protein